MSLDCVYLDDQPEFCSYANVYSYLEQYSTLEGFKYPYSTVSLGEEGTCLAALATSVNRLVVLDATSGEVVFEISLSEGDLFQLVKSTAGCTESGTICCVHLSVKEEYLPARYLVDLWLVYSNGIEFSLVLLLEFCVQVTLCVGDISHYFTSIELLALPENIFPLQLVFVNDSSRYWTSAELSTFRCILGMNVGGPIALLEPWKEMSFTYCCAILVCNYSILKVSSSGENSLTIENWMEELPCITSVLLFPATCWPKIDDDEDPCWIIGTIQGNIECISMKNSKKPKKIYQMNSAVKKLSISRQFLVACDELGDGIIIPLSSLYLSFCLDKLVDKQYIVTFSVGGGMVQVVEKMNDYTFLLLSNSAGYQYLRIQMDTTQPCFYCKWITLIGTSVAYTGWTLSKEFRDQEQEMDMIYIATDGSFLVISSTAVSNYWIKKDSCDAIALSCGESTTSGAPSEMDSIAADLFQQVDDWKKIQQRYENIFRDLQQEMTRFHLLLQWYDKTRKETQENGGFHIAIKQVRRIETAKGVHRCVEEPNKNQNDDYIPNLYHITIEWTYQGADLSIPFSILVQWENVSNDDIRVLSQHIFSYLQLTNGARELVEIPLYKTNGLPVHLRIFWIMDWNHIGTVLAHRRHSIPVWLELSCERNWLDVLDFCEVSTQIPCNDIVKERHSRVNTCQMSNPYRQRCFQSSLLPVEWNCSENDWFISIKTPWNEPVVLIDRVGTIVLQCFSRWSLVLFHTSLWKRFHRIPLSHTKPIAPVEEERWRDNNKVISHSLQQAQMELQRTEQMLQQIRNSEDESCGGEVFVSLLEAYRLWRGCCFVTVSNNTSARE